jgi:hypothetical protein
VILGVLVIPMSAWRWSDDKQRQSDNVPSSITSSFFARPIIEFIVIHRVSSSRYCFDQYLISVSDELNFIEKLYLKEQFFR